MKAIAQILFGLAMIYLALAGWVWEIRNPTANRWTFWTEFGHVIRFEKLQKYNP